MSTLRVDTITDAAGTGAPNFSQNIQVGAEPIHKVQAKTPATVATATYSNQSLTSFTNLDSAKYYRLSFAFELDEKSGASNLCRVQLRQTTAGGTLLRDLYKHALIANNDNIVQGSNIFTGISGTVHVSVTTAGNAELQQGGITGEHVTLEELNAATITTDFT